MNKTILALVAFSLIACKRDDSNPSPSIVGVWKEKEVVVYSGKDNNMVLAKEKPDVCEQKSTYEFTKDNKFITTIFVDEQGKCIEDGSYKGTYEYNASTKKLKLIKENEDETDVHSVTDNEIGIVLDSRDENKDGVEDNVIMYLTRVK